MSKKTDLWQNEYVSDRRMDGRTDRPTNGLTDQWIDTRSDRDAGMHVEIPKSVRKSSFSHVFITPKGIFVHLAVHRAIGLSIL